jgi:predicted nucleic acid-binding protein
VTTGSNSRRELPGPLYLDASALAKIYMAEPGSEELERTLKGRRDLLLSDLAVTEVASALARRQREGSLTANLSARLHRKMLEDSSAGLFERVGLDPETHRQAERILLAQAVVPLRAADALHLALATAARASSIVTFDARLAEGARAIGLRSFPDSPAGG